MASILVSVGTDGATNWVELPTGQKFNLGMTSVLSFVTKLVKNAGLARKTVQDFLKQGEALVSVDADRMWDLLAPPQRRWASDSLMSPDQQKPRAQEITKMSEVWDELAKEADTFSRLAAQQEPVEEDTEDEGDSKDAASKETDSTKKATQKLSFDVYSSNMEIAQGILASARETLKTIDTKVAEGRKFNADRARADVLAITSKTGSICEQTQLIEDWVGSDLQKLSAEMVRIHSLFHPQAQS